MDKRAQQEYESIRKEADPKLFSDYLRARPVQEQKRHFFNLYLSMFNSKPTGDFINNMKWRFWRVETDDYEFYTSDRPIVKTNGLRSPRGHLLIPVAPNFVFLAASSDEVFRDIISLKPKLLIKEANRIVVGGAVKFAYSTKDDCGKFMRNNFGTKPQPRIAATMTF